MSRILLSPVVTFRMGIHSDFSKPVCRIHSVTDITCPLFISLLSKQAVVGLRMLYVMDYVDARLESRPSQLGKLQTKLQTKQSCPPNRRPSLNGTPDLEDMHGKQQIWEGVCHNQHRLFVWLSQCWEKRGVNSESIHHITSVPSLFTGNAELHRRPL